MYHIVYTKEYKRSIKKLVKAGKVTLSEVEYVIDIIACKKDLSEKYRDHKLHDEFSGYKECHVRPDVLLIYMVHKEELILLIVNIGSHAQLFG